MGASNTVRRVVFGVKNAIPVALCSQIQAEVPGSVHFSDKDGDFTILHRQKYTKSAEELKKAKTSAALVSVSEGSPAVTPRGKLKSLTWPVASYILCSFPILVIIRKDDSRYIAYPSSEGQRSVDLSNTTSQQSERLFLEHYHIDASSGYSSNRSSPVSNTSTTDNDNLVATSNTIHTAVVASQVPTKVISLSADGGWLFLMLCEIF
ncbi:hypothetical protein M422DRAFT_52844 [Sphaerobolus stellatus SS14]|uniref:Uncharacterized protein n=1 Tax=Sphaerobolus stellatus (strain SS14) TaxID=990650 RepID=A0A0C9V4N9_SPHS4|nr:hypothetical protein M422DRAFT_52844 [Sphaerobolus stellatus SS14]